MSYIKKKSASSTTEVLQFPLYSMVWKLTYIPVISLLQSISIVEWLGLSTENSPEIGN